MNKKFRTIAVAALMTLTLACFAFLGIDAAKNVEASSPADASVYENLVENGNFETEFTTWGVNGVTLQAVKEGENTVGKVTEPGFVQARIWNASFMYDRVYRVSFKLKFETSGEAGSAQFLGRIKGNDGAFGGEKYVDVNLNGNLVANEWVTKTFFLKIVDNKDGTYSILTGANSSTLSNVYGEQTFNAELSYFDVAVGCGNIGNLTAWYIDDFEIIDYAGYENLVENGDFQTEYTSWGVNSMTPEKVAGEDGNVYGKITSPGWLNARIWNASFLYGKTYRASINYKPVTSDGAATSNQFLAAIKSNDGSHFGEFYVTFGGEAGLTSGQWRTFAFYFTIVSEDGEDVFYTGANPSSLTEKARGTKGALSYLDVAFGCGAMGNLTEYYADDFVINEYDEKQVAENSSMTDIFPANGWGMNSFPTTRVWDNEKQSYVAKLNGGGWLQTRLWKANVKLNALYRINLQLKQNNVNATADGQFLIQTKNSDKNEQINYIDIGCNAGQAKTNVYSSFVAYFKIVDNGDGTISLLGGKTKSLSNLRELGSFADFSHFDIAIGAGNVGSTTDWFVDNFTITDLSSDEVSLYNGEITVKDADNNPLEGFTFKISGTYENAETNGNVISIENIAGEVSVLISKDGYVAKTVTLTKDEAAKETVLEKRTTVADISDYTGELFPYASFENLALGTKTNYIGEGVGLATFVNGGSSYMVVTNEDSYFGEKSLKAYTGGDRMVFRLVGGNEGYQKIYKGTTYHAVMYVKGTVEGQQIQPCMYVSYYVEGDVVTSGAKQGINETLSLGAAVTLSTEEWTRIELNVKYEITDGKLVITWDGGSKTYESCVEGKKIIEACWLDLSLSTKPEFFVDDVAFFKTYDAEVEVLNVAGDRVTDGVVWTIKDYQNRTLDITPVKNDKGAYVFGGLYGKVSFIATVGDKTYAGTTLDVYNKLTLAEAYAATVKVCDYSGAVLTGSFIKEIFALDGANVILAVYSDEKGGYVFENCMGELKVYVYAKGYVQHVAYVVTRKDGVKTIALEKAPAADDGLEGNSALNGNPEELNQIEMYNSRDYAIEGVGSTGANDKWASFQPVLTLSDEALVGEKSLRISTDTRALRADDPAYDEFMTENELEDRTFGDRVSYRAGNGFITDGSVYKYSVYVKAPALQEDNTEFSFINLTTFNLCNNGQFNLWVPRNLSVSSKFWSNIEVYFSYNVVVDEDASRGNYEFERYKLIYTCKGYLNGEKFVDVSFEYGYEQYKDGVWAFYQPSDDGTVTTFGELDTTRHDGTVKDQEGGRSFGSIAFVEPSIQITNNKSLLVDGLTITKEYTADVKVLKKDLSADDTIKYLKLTDRYTGKVIYLEAADYYDDIDRKYYIPGLYHSYDVTATNEDKEEIEGLRGQIVSSEKSDAVIEYDYSIKITVKNQLGELVSDVVIRIVLRNGSSVEAKNNNDGTYTYSGLSGVRTINFRKASGSENSYTFPTGLTVSSANNEFTVTVTKKTNDASDSSDTGSSSTEEKGCVGSISAVSLGVVALLGAAAIILKKKNG